ncbi:MAG: dienelactone hydrolase family protein [Bdellovibrionota bacterium]
MEIQDIRFPTGSGKDMRGWLCAPTNGAAASPGVLVIHEATGLVENIRPVLRRFAENGYVALAPNLFDKPGSKPLCVARTMTAMVTGKGEALNDLESAKAFLREQASVNPDRLAVAGFCMGGGFALLLALTSGIKASAPYYGMSPAYLEKIEQSCPVIASYGGRDAVMRQAWPGLEKALKRSGIPHEFKVYPGAGHSYFTEDQPGLLFQLGKLGPLKGGYCRDESEDSWERMLTFFAKHV